MWRMTGSGWGVVTRVEKSGHHSPRPLGNIDGRKEPPESPGLTQKATLVGTLVPHLPSGGRGRPK